MTDDRTSSKAQRTVIIVGVDGSEDGLRAARYAAVSAIKRDADLIVLHAVDDAAVAGAWESSTTRPLCRMPVRSLLMTPSTLRLSGDGPRSDLWRGRLG